MNQCQFQGHFLPTLEREESLTGKAFIADAAEKWRNLNEEEKHKHFQVRLPDTRPIICNLSLAGGQGSIASGQGQ